MLRNLIVLCVLALSGCATYSEPRYGARQPVYDDGSYYSPAAEGYGDYYYAPESSGYYYDDYYDASNRYFRGPSWFSGYSPWCSYGHRYGYYYRPCSYGYGYGYGRPGWGLSIFFGDRWGWGGGWSSYWPYDHRNRWHDRDHRRDRDGRDWNQDREDEPRRPNPRDDDDRNQRYPDSVPLPQRRDSDREPRIRMRPIPGDRNERPRNDRPPLIGRPVSTVPSGDRNGPPPRSRDEGYGGFRGPGVGDRNGGDRNVAPRPDRPLVRNEPRPVPVERVERPSVEREERNERNDRSERSSRSRDDDRPESRSRPRLQ